MQFNVKAGAVPTRRLNLSLVKLFAVIPTLWLCTAATAEEEVLIGPDYCGPKCVIAVGDFTMGVRGAPVEIGDGLREMLMTALFESRRFIVVGRLDGAGISAEQLLSDSFLSDPDAILAQGKMDPAEVLVYGAVVNLEGGGMGLGLKVPFIPVKFGGAYHQAKVGVELRVVDSATGRVLAATTAEGSALSGRGNLGISESSLPFELEAFRNTPLELALRDCIYRSVIDLCKMIPGSLFRHVK